MKEKQILNRIRNYAQWHIDTITEEIKDYIDDDRLGNRDIIGQLKEEREHWRDIIKINNEKYEVINDESLNQLGCLIPNRNYLAIRHSTLEHIFNEYRNIKILTHELCEKDFYVIKEKK